MISRNTKYSLILFIMWSTYLNAFLGIAYQSFNKPLGVWTTKAQLQYDLDLMKSIGVSSLRVEIPWQNIHIEEEKYNFSTSDMLIKEASKRGIKLHVIIGFQWPPLWVKEKHLQRRFDKDKTVSPLMNYLDPFIEKTFLKYLSKITKRYKNNKNIQSWILGNEFSYIEYATFKQLGADDLTISKFREYLRKRKPKLTLKNINELIIRSDLDVERPIIKSFFNFKREIIANLISKASLAVKNSDPDTPRAYSMIGVLFSQFNKNYTSEDIEYISRSCDKVGAPLKYIALNSYLNLNSKENFNLGLSAKLMNALTNKEIFYSEFGITSSEIYANIGEEKQQKFIKAQTLEAIIDKIPQIHLFTLLEKPFVDRREIGFGILNEKRKKKPAFNYLSNLSKKLNEFQIDKIQNSFKDSRDQVTFVTPEFKTGFAQFTSWYNEVWTIASYFEQANINVQFIRPDQIKNTDPKTKLIILANLPTLLTETSKKIFRFAEEKNIRTWSLSRLPSSNYSNTQEYKNFALKTWGVTNHQIATNPQTMFSAFVLLTKENEYTSYSTWHFDLSSYNTYANKMFPFKNKWIKGLPGFSYFLNKKGNNYFTPVSIGYHSDNTVVDTSEATNNNKKRKKILLKSFLYKEVFKELLGDIYISQHDITIKTNSSKNATIAYASFIPPIERHLRKNCQKRKVNKTIMGLKKETEFLTIPDSNILKSTKNGEIVITLSECDSILLVENKETFKKQPPTFQKAPSNRSTIFPDRIGILDPPSCAINILKRHGYVNANIGVWFDEKARFFHIEPVKGYYKLEKLDKNQIKRLIPVIVTTKTNINDLTTQKTKVINNCKELSKFLN